MIKKVLILALFIVAAVVWLNSRDESHLTNFPPRGTNTVAFGDSLVQGVGASPGNNFVSRVSRELGINIANMGRSGDTTAAGLSRIETVLVRNPDIVLLLLGGNDALKRVPLAETEANLRMIISKLQERGAMVMLIGVRGGIANDPYSDMYRNLAQETGSILVTDVLRGLLGDKRYMADMVHPNDAGHEIIARRITLQLRDVVDRAGTGGEK